MTDGSNSGMEFASTVSFFYENVKKKNPNYFDLLGIPTNATHREIQDAYHKYASEFDISKVSGIADTEVKEQAQFLVHLGQRAFEVLTDFEKRAEYEKKGYREIDPDAIKEEDPEETAREYYKKSKNLYNQKKYRLAVKGLNETVMLDPKKADYFLLLGLAQTQLPEMKREAEVNLNKARELEQWNVEPIVALGLLFMSIRLNNRAEGFFRKALEIQNDHQVARKKLEELVGPQIKPLEKIKSTLQKVFPTFFKK